MHGGTSKIKAGSVSNQMLNNVDMFATFAALTGQPLSADNSNDSINMLPAILGEATTPLRTEMIVTPRKATHVGLRKGKWMYIGAQNDGGFKGSKPHQHAYRGTGCHNVSKYT
ncbi:hypothetical protein [Psychrosphaera algicola]|uniref:Uncharacterized protein n=1 Tax=Psychrosphaera algicola TaxID=3023714 RepID=A0ABT5FAH9_9GAMM|nr:hypothetical protein [Psychrosphaera sp. G1-22]MDC2888548.1 hypothetical protein [Psychrosphaera sp. G1-22]